MFQIVAAWNLFLFAIKCLSLSGRMPKDQTISWRWLILRLTNHVFLTLWKGVKFLEIRKVIVISKN